MRKNLYRPKHKPYPKALSHPSLVFNPCGAYCTGGCSNDFDMGNSMNTDCRTHAGSGHDDGFCCDMMGRIAPATGWEYGKNYKIYQNIVAQHNDCAGCYVNAWEDNHSDEGACSTTMNFTFYKNEPCKGCLVTPPGVVEGWRYVWSGCADPLNFIGRDGCTNPNSFGTITNATTVAEQSNAGCPNPNSMCTQNCMMLLPGYYNTHVAGTNATNRVNTLIYGGFDKKNCFDCEPNDPNNYDNTSIQGMKLIFAGVGNNSSTGNYQTASSDAIDGQSYSFKSGSWRGYRNTMWHYNNAHGQLGQPGGPPTQASSHLWRRRSQFKINGVNRYSTDFDSCCNYVSFGCTDPNFGNYDNAAQLNCAGIPYNNKEDQNGDCLTPLGDPGTCYDSFTLDCAPCLDNNGEYASGNIGTVVGCTQDIWDACGGGGTLLSAAWTDMWAARPTSHIYGQGQVYTKEGTRLTVSSAPKCQCTNTGCMNPIYDNGSNTNTKDCEEAAPGFGTYPTAPFGNERCCTTQMFGCTDESSDNYFCSIIGSTPGVPQNQMWCMDPTTGDNCAAFPTSPGCLTTASPPGGAPLNNVTSTNQSVNNGVVQLIDDGTCNLNLASGCNDNGLTFTSLYPPGSTQCPNGCAALNYDGTIGINNPAACIYALACTDPLADNVINGTQYCVPGFPNETSAGALATAINALPDPPPVPITAQYVLDNTVSNPICCDYPFEGGPGCMDPSALNFDPTATVPLAGACLYATEGCTDPNAINYNSLNPPMVDDGSCIYSIDDPAEGTNFLDGSEILLCMDPLTKEEVLMNVCEPPKIQSEVFIERGTQTVFEPNQRLGEINTIGGLEIYGYGFYNIKRQI